MPGIKLFVYLFPTIFPLETRSLSPREWGMCIVLSFGITLETVAGP